MALGKKRFSTKRSPTEVPPTRISQYCETSALTTLCMTRHIRALNLSTTYYWVTFITLGCPCTLNSSCETLLKNPWAIQKHFKLCQATQYIGREAGEGGIGQPLGDSAHPTSPKFRVWVSCCHELSFHSPRFGGVSADVV